LLFHQTYVTREEGGSTQIAQAATAKDRAGLAQSSIDIDIDIEMEDEEEEDYDAGHVRVDEVFASQDTLFQRPSRVGRPDWMTIFACIKERHPHEHIGVFGCGPKKMMSDCREASSKHSQQSSDQSATFFHFREEVFY